ncbi:glycogen debranching protein GlgX [Alkalispirochaeta alkalica]|uniref:glycogen debranching protein GlgX n=1 Tax=Alkalispirochaeta alkalica TaxID=46356 RepID=UPI00036F1B41|nr:glycogen debranching protein GlgX [Alkalispirochaeta alkalica]
MQYSEITTQPGKPYPLGATPLPGRVHFGLVSRHATRVWLQLYSDPQARFPEREFELLPELHRTGDVWHIEVQGIGPGAMYLFRVDGPFSPEEGLRFNPYRPLLDPYAKALTGNFTWNLREALAYDHESPRKDLSLRTTGDAGAFPKCIVVDDLFDWQGDRPLNYPLQDCIIYEAHLRGLSCHPSAEVAHPGTYRGVIEMIPYLKELGITSLELLPVHEFDEHEFERYNPETGERLINYWGYNTVAFFAPKGAYAADGALGEQVAEFKEMVRELHKAGIEVILDVVFNHSGEGSELGPTFSFRGIDNPTYYMLEDDRRYYRNFSGTGNTMNCNNPVMRTLIMECLHYWVVDMHVDGFRFDLGSILGRDERGHLLENAPILDRIANDPVLRDTKIIAEAWDAGGAYQVGAFRGRWAEWNDRFRDDLRRYWRGDRNTVAALATRFAGSADLYHAGGRKPFHSINFITSHDGFTLRDLVSYNRKHNEENGEENRDGHNGNFSYNYGHEGETEDPEIRALRLRQMKNLMGSLLLSLGTPMILSGDEFGRTQGGNNNAYCQNNAISWNDYRLGVDYGELFRFTRMLIALRKRHPVFTRPEFYTGLDNSRSTRNDIDWFDSGGGRMDWAKNASCLAIYIDGTEIERHANREDDDFYIMFNASREEEPFSVPDPPEGLRWVRVIDTSKEPPGDFCEPGLEEGLPPELEISLQGRSLVVLRTAPDIDEE